MAVIIGQGGTQLFVTTKLIYKSIRSCIIEIYIFLFDIFLGQHFENGLVEVQYGHIFIAKL